jgi:hypothetical protein
VTLEDADGDLARIVVIFDEQHARRRWQACGRHDPIPNWFDVSTHAGRWHSERPGARAAGK